MAIRYEVDVLRRNLAAEFRRGGQGERWLDRLRRKMHARAEATCPSRTNTLKKSHRSDVHGFNQYRCEAFVENIADHAEYVHNGRPGMKGKKGKPLILPPGGPGRNSNSPYVGESFGRKALKHVGPQGPNPWLEEACTAISMSVGAFRIS